MIDQLTVFLQNEKGRLSAACETLGEANINLHSLFIADTQDFGVVRLICDTPQKASKALSDAGFRAAVTSVLAVKVPNVAGGLSKLLKHLDSFDVNVEYGYCFSTGATGAIDVLKIDGGDEVEQKLRKEGFETLCAKDVYAED